MDKAKNANDFGTPLTEVFNELMNKVIKNDPNKYVKAGFVNVSSPTPQYTYVDASPPSGWVISSSDLTSINSSMGSTYGHPGSYSQPARSVDKKINLKAQIEKLQAELALFNNPKLSAGKAADVADIVDHMKGLGFYLGGSRQKLNDNDYFSYRDWDFHIQKSENMNDALEYVQGCFKVEHGEDAVQYKDKFFDSYHKHYLYPHITVIINKELTLYKKIWEKLDKQYWHNYIWKSNPYYAQSLKDDPSALKKFKAHNRAFFNMMHDMVEMKLEDLM